MTTYATETRPTYFGIVLALYPSDVRNHIEIQRAPDSSGSPDTANAETIGIAAPGQRTFTDLRSSGTWHYRIRHVRPGATPSDWIGWAAATAKPIPDQLPNVPDVGGWIIKQGRLESTDGAIVLDAPNENMRMGAATSPTSGIGFFAGLDGTNPDKYDLRVGDPSGGQMWWDHSEELLKYTGTLEANGIRYGPLHMATTDRGTGASGSEVTLETISIPAGALGTQGGIRLTAHFNTTGATGAKLIRVYLAGTLVLSYSFSASGFTGRSWLEALIANTGSATAQRSHGTMLLEATGSTQIDTDTSAVDTSAAVDLTIVAQTQVSSDEITLELSLAELIAPGA